MTTSPSFRVLGLAVAVLGSLGSAAAQAQQAAAAAPKAELKPAIIAIIDMSKVSSESLLGKGYAAELEKLRNEIDAERTKKQNELGKLETAIKTLQDEIDKQAQVLSPEALEKKRQELTKKNRDRQAYIEDGQADIQRLQDSAQAKAQNFNNEFQGKIRPHVEAVVKEKGIDILLDSQVTLTMNKTFDISQDVIVRADEAERAAKPKPAAAASPAPKP